MTNQEIKEKAFNALREIAVRADTSVRAIQELATKTLYDDVKFLQSVNDLRNQEIQREQLKLMKLQTENEIMQGQCLRFKLKRMIWIRTKLGIIKKEQSQ